jgi:hypothetical protein
MLKPSGETVTESVAALIVRHHEAGEQSTSIMGMFGCSYTTVKRVLRQHAADGSVRVSQQGRGKTSDRRWIFAGHDGPGHLAQLNQIAEREDADMLFAELHALVEAGMPRPPAYSTMTHVLRTQLNFSTKRVRESHRTDRHSHRPRAPSPERHAVALPTRRRPCATPLRHAVLTSDATRVARAALGHRVRTQRPPLHGVAQRHHHLVYPRPAAIGRRVVV